MLSIIRRFVEFVHKRVDPIGFAKKSGVILGSDCRLVSVSFGSEPWLVRLGNHVSATEVAFVTHDGSVWALRDKHPKIDVVAPITVGNNVFIGSRTIILPGVRIGDNVVIGAGSIVSRDIPSDCVAVGIPAKPIRSLSEHEEKILAKSENTKGMSLASKREFYERKFRDRLVDHDHEV